MADDTESGAVASVTDATEVGTSGAQGTGQAPGASTDDHGGRSTAAVARAVRTHAWVESHNLVSRAARCVGIVYDEEMMLHCGPQGHPEQPARIHEINAQLDMAGLLAACAHLPPREATEEELELVHDAAHVQRVAHFEAPSRRKPKPFSFPFGPDTYVCQHTPRCARLAAGSLLGLVDACLDTSSQVSCGMAVIRPPGHHATIDKASGFCLFNNVAVAARYMQRRHGLSRVAVVDWDVHHGNGTNDIFAEDPSVLFFSIHRSDNQRFFPGTGVLEDAGKSEARGYNINVPLDKGYADPDIYYIVRYVLCPALDAFRPEAILVSAGFDAARGDPLGECRVSPEGFGWFTRCLHRIARHLCEGRLVLALEGGYNPDMIAQCSVECVLSLVAETSGISVPCSGLPGRSMPRESHAESGTSTPATSGTPAPTPPALSPMLQSCAPKADSPPEHMHVPGHGFAPGSPGPATAKQKVRAATARTMKTVRKLTELHNMLALKLPVAPKPNEGPGHSGKSARKNERRKQRRSEGDTDGDMSSDSSGWAIACGSDPEPPFSPSASSAVPLSTAGGSASGGDESVPGAFACLELPAAARQCSAASSSRGSSPGMERQGSGRGGGHRRSGRKAKKH